MKLKRAPLDRPPIKKRNLPLDGEEVKAAERLRKLWDDRAPKLGLTQESAGAELDMNQSAVYQYLSGNMALGFEACIKWGALLGVDPAEIRPGFTSRLDDVVRLRNGAALNARPMPTLLRTCIAEAHRACEAADRYPSPQAVAEIAADLYGKAVAELDRG